MKRKILVPMFASVMALSMNTIANADEVENNHVENKEDNTTNVIDLPNYEDVTYKVATVKDGVAVKIREQGSVQNVAYTGDEFKVVGVQGDWVKVKVGDGEGWIATRFVDIKEAHGYITSNKVNLRKEANTESEIVEELEVGSTMKVLEDNGSWIKVKKGENEGYIRSLYVSEEAPVIETEEETTQENVQASTDNNTITNENQNSNSNSQNSNKNQSSDKNQNSNKNQSSNNNGGQAQKPVQKPAQKPSQDNGSYNPPASDTSLAQAVVNLAYAKIGSPYVWGAEGPNSFDCSGLTSYVYKQAAGISLPRSSSAQAGYGKTVSKSNLQPGDLVFFTTNGTGNVSHVGIYIGGGNMIHSPKPGQSVHVTSINSSYYTSKFVTAKRVF
ncbi:C40 family peptidase [[Clostridium] dakarense]|uniref:C40 family peptidase n=1 Tax=Faecalimicrobium dakarense TaxID=1301100 RepID=UPI0004B298CE|nr:C40 family peptidase [[Clostridium] dakarense]